MPHTEGSSSTRCIAARSPGSLSVHAGSVRLYETGQDPDATRVDGWISTHMCFDATRVRAWLQGIRAAGMTLPVRLGVPGVVDRARLLKVGTRIGIGASLRYVSKNRSTVMRLMSPGGYDPTDLVAEFADDAQRLGIEALHSFTFNSVADTARWQAAIAAAA